MHKYIDGWKNSEHRRVGCLPRISKPGEFCPLFSERIKIIPKREWSDILKNSEHMRLRPSVPVVLDQDGVGSCATESAAQCVMTCRSFHGQKFNLLNPWFVYHTTSGGRDGGSNLDTNLRFVREHGIAPESIWPRANGWRKRPSSEAQEAALDYKILEFYDIQNSEEFGSALLLGYPVCYGRRGHSITGVDLIDENNFRMVNSWGDWGDAGFAVESLRGINWKYGAWAVRVATDTSTSPVILRSSEMPFIQLEPCPQITE